MDEGALGKIKENKVETQELSVDHAAMLLFLSFRFSQGNMSLQKEILKWVHVAYPFYRINPESLKQIKDKVTQMSSAFILKATGRHTQSMPGGEEEKIALKHIHEQVSTYANFFEEILRDDFLVAEYKEATTINLLNDMLKRDFKYSREYSRPGENRQQGSYIEIYGFEQKTTGMAEYDEMFREIVQFVRNEKVKISKRSRDLLEDIMSANKRTHE